jgi:hypothetical protein
MLNLAFRDGRVPYDAEWRSLTALLAGAGLRLSMKPAAGRLKKAA